MSVPPTPMMPTPVMRCPHCGTANRAGSNFCNGCGTDMRESQTLDDLAASRDDLARAAQDDPSTPTTPPSPAQLFPVPPLPDVNDDNMADDTMGGDVANDDVTDNNDDFINQPWLRLEFAGDDETGADAESDANFDDSGRLVTAVQGLLTPIRIATNISDETPLAKPALPTVENFSNDELRLIRGLMSEQPALVNYQVRPALRPPLPLRISWIFALLGVAVGLPALLFFGGPTGTPHRWSGVEDAYLTIQGVAPATFVVVYFAYDPATAGEVDLAMQPVMRHLLQRRARIAVLTSTPGGIASAERLINQVRTSQGTGNLALAADLAQPITFAYLPGGAATLPLVARDRALALVENILVDERADAVPRPGLIVVAAAQSEDVQNWLEQVQPLEQIPVIAVTAAGADPLLRPYHDSRQLSGLVSGFDGGYAYRQLLDPFVAPETNNSLLQQIILQNWGHFALLAVIALGNLAALLSREGGA